MAVTLGEGGGFILSASPVLYSFVFSGAGAPVFQGGSHLSGLALMCPRNLMKIS